MPNSATRSSLVRAALSLLISTEPRYPGSWIDTSGPYFSFIARSFSPLKSRCATLQSRLTAAVTWSK